jgi:ADP-ribosylglycohydrolase
MRRATQRQDPGKPLGTRTEPINDSKGSAAMVRAAACGFGDDLAEAFESGGDIAALTHGHPSAWLAAGTFAAIVLGLYEHMTLHDAGTCPARTAPPAAPRGGGGRGRRRNRAG